MTAQDGRARLSGEPTTSAPGGATPAAWLGLGANLPPRIERLRAAARALVSLHEGPGAPVVSSVWETAPWGRVEQPHFLNLVVGIDTALDPHALLERAAALEAAAGRTRALRWGPRTLDVDLLLFGDRRVDSDRLVVPHPRLAERRFVLEPLAEVAPERVDPRSGATVAALAERLRAGGDGGRLVRLGDPFDPRLDGL